MGHVTEIIDNIIIMWNNISDYDNNKHII